MLLLVIGAAGDVWRAGHVVRAGLPAGSPAPAAAPGVRPPGADSGGSTPARALVVDLNSADERALDALPGIGPVLAARIVQHRRERGPFRDPDELLAVRGIGPRLLERLRPLVRTGPAKVTP